jgi:serine O-acetyltransferase
VGLPDRQNGLMHEATAGLKELVRADLEWQVEQRGSRQRWYAEVVAKTFLYPRLRAVLYYRVGQALARHRLLPLAYWLEKRAIAGSGAEINPLARLGPGLNLMHSVGVVIGPEVQVGARAMIYQGVTLGDGSTPGQPRIGDDVVIGAGAAVLGGVKVGDRVVIGAHAVVTHDVPDDVIAIGAPATYRPRNMSAAVARSAVQP